MKLPEIQLIPLREAISTEQSTTLDLIVRIIPPELEEPLQRPVLNIGLVIDRSGSMEGKKIEYARQAAGYAVQQLLPTDRISVTIYDDQIDSLIPSTLAVGKADILRKIQQITARNTTALHEGWVQGGVQVSQYLNPQHLNRVILLSDGLANAGETNPDVICHDVQGLARRGVSTSTIGLGQDYNEDLMTAMARSGEGNYYYIQSPEQLPNIFSKELQGLATTMGTTVTLGIEPQAGVEIAEMLNDLDLNSNGRFKLPNLALGDPLEIVVRLKIPAMAQTVDLCYFRLAWNEPNQHERQVMRQALRLPSVSSVELEALPFSSEVRQKVALLVSARAKKEAVKLIDRRDYASARQVLQQTKQQLQEQTDLPLMAAEADALEDLDTQLQAEEIAITRKMATEQVFQNFSAYSPGHSHSDLYYRYSRGPRVGDICDSEAEAIVNSTDGSLSSNGPLSNAIHQAAGPELAAECHRLRHCPEGEAIATPGYQLKAKWVIHTVPPRWQGGTQNEEKILAQCYRRCLQLAVQSNIQSIAFPAIATGLSGFPSELAATIAFEETSRFLRSHSAMGRIYFFCANEEIHRHFQAQFQKIAGW